MRSSTSRSLAAGIAVWLPIVGTLPAPEWFGTGAKLVYVVGVRSVESPTLVTLSLLAALFLRLQVESEARQTLVERGIDERRARRAVRYGRWRRLADV